VAIINGFIGLSKVRISLLTSSLADFILGHESLLNAGILHRDISIGNIMFTENEDDGFLIDFDLSNKTSDDEASGAPSKTGTKIFMAIGALLGEPHNFMHDLESFFWVLFWICIHYDGLDEKGKVKRRIVPNTRSGITLAPKNWRRRREG
jgi:serine/threonine protein kinase